jgi:hypothetical protein
MTMKVVARNASLRRIKGFATTLEVPSHWYRPAQGCAGCCG